MRNHLKFIISSTEVVRDDNYIASITLGFEELNLSWLSYWDASERVRFFFSQLRKNSGVSQKMSLNKNSASSKTGIVEVGLIEFLL